MCSYGNKVETSLSARGHIYTDFGSGRRGKERTEKLIQVG